MRKMLDVVKALPFTADDVHHTRNAHGTFADTLFEVAAKRKAAKQKSDKVGCCMLHAQVLLASLCSCGVSACLELVDC